MIRRAGFALLFALCGVISLLFVDSIHSWLCAHVAGFCQRATGPCPDIDICTSDSLRRATIFATYFGPPIVFGVSGFSFSVQRRHILAWSALLTSLVVAHALIMEIVVKLTAK